MPVKNWEWRTDPKVIEEINNELKELFEHAIQKDNVRERQGEVLIPIQKEMDKETSSSLLRN